MISNNVMIVAVILVGGLTYAWPRVMAALVRRHVEAIERPILFDPITAMSEEGTPLLLHDPAFDTTFVFFDGFRIRPAASMHRDWLEDLYLSDRVNVLAPVLGHQSMPFDLRNREWSHFEECRASIQLLDAYRAAKGPEHRIIVAGFSWGAIHAYTLAALGRCDGIVLISPLPHRLDIQVDSVVKRRTVAAAALRSVLRALTAGRGYAIARRVLPYYVRRGVSGGWDVAHPELRALYNQRYLNGQELRIYDVYEILQAIQHVGTELLPRIVDTDVTVAWGEKDTIISGAVFEDLADAMRRNGNAVRSIEIADSAHNVLHDVGARDVHGAVSAAIARARSAERLGA